MKENVSFNVKVAVGFAGVAALSVTERTVNIFPASETSCVHEDIIEMQPADWVEDLPLNESISEGIYMISGTAWFADDDRRYLSAVASKYQDA